MQGTDKLNTITKIVFVLTDVLETNLLEMQQQYKKEGFELRHDSKRNFNTAIAAIKRLKSDVNLKSFQIVQSRAVCNGTSEYHDRIIRLVEKNMSLIKKRIA